MCNIRRCGTLADFLKPGIYRSGRVWANAWDVFGRAPSRGGRGRRDAVDFVLCFGRGGSYFVFSFFCLNTHGRLQVRGRLASFTPLLVPGCVQGAIIISLSVCVTLVVFTD